MKSPLKDDLNFRCTAFLKKKIPQGSIVHSFLFYGGEAELSLARSKRFVVAHTNRYALYEFWTCALHDPLRVSQAAEYFFPIENESLFEVLQKGWDSYRGHFTRAGIFFLLNHCSIGGFVSCGELKNENFSPMVLHRLRGFSIDNFYLFYDECEDYLRGIDAVKRADYLLFPVGKYSFNLFDEGKNRGSETTLVNHKKLKEKLQKLDRKWVVVYKYHPRVLKEYKDYNVTMISKYGQPTKHENMCEDIVIANF